MNPHVKRTLFLAMGIALISTPLAAQEQDDPMAQFEHIQQTGTYLINTPTAYTLPRASYNFKVFAHDRGGIEVKTFVGVHDNIYFGLSFDTKQALGGATMRPQIPGVVAKLKLVDGFLYVPAIAVGYDSFYEAKNRAIVKADSSYQKLMNGPNFVVINPYVYLYRKNVKKDLFYNDVDIMTYGPYLSFTSPIFLFKSEQFICYGVRMPVQPQFRPNDISYFFGLDIPLGRYFRIKAELERVFWNFRKPDEWFVNCGARVTFFDQLGIEFDVLIEPGEKVTRVLTIEYHGEF